MWHTVLTILSKYFCTTKSYEMFHESYKWSIATTVVRSFAESYALHCKMLCVCIRTE